MCVKHLFYAASATGPTPYQDIGLCFGHEVFFNEERERERESERERGKKRSHARTLIGNGFMTQPNGKCVKKADLLGKRLAGQFLGRGSYRQEPGMPITGGERPAPQFADCWE